MRDIIQKQIFTRDYLKQKKLLLISKADKGFTLVEMLLYIGLLSIFLFVLTDIFVSSLNVKIESEATSAVEQDGRYVLSRLAYDMGRAESITTPSFLGETTNTLGINVDGVGHAYSLVDGDLILAATTSGRLNSDKTNVSDLFFQRVGNVDGKHTVRVNFTLTSVVVQNKGPEVRVFQTTYGLK